MCTSQFSNRFVSAAAPHSGTHGNIGLQRVEASDLTLPTRFSVRGKDEIPMDRTQTTLGSFVFATASTPDTSLYSEPLELIWNDFPWIVETRCRRRFFTSSDEIDELTRDSLRKLGSSARGCRRRRRDPLLLPWWLKVDRRFDSPIYLFGCEEHFRIRSHCPG